MPEGMNPLLLSMSVERDQAETDEILELSGIYIYGKYTSDYWNWMRKISITQITDDCDRFCRWAYRIMGAVVTAGIGTVCDSLYDISISYERAREAVSYRVLYGTKRAINIGEIVPKEQIKPVQSEESRMQMLFRAIRIGDVGRDRAGSTWRDGKAS